MGGWWPCWTHMGHMATKTTGDSTRGSGLRGVSFGVMWIISTVLACLMMAPATAPATRPENVAARADYLRTGMTRIEAINAMGGKPNRERYNAEGTGYLSWRGVDGDGDPLEVYVRFEGGYVRDIERRTQRR
jgi:hypothetical protein